MTEYKIIDTVSRFVKRFGMIMDPVTMNQARDEAKDYDFRLISPNHYAIRHARKMYVIIERDGDIGCSCDDMTYNRMDGSVCKHIIAFSRLMVKITNPINEMDKGHLTLVCGWRGEDLRPKIELGEPGAVIQEDTTPIPKATIPPDPDPNVAPDATWNSRSSAAHIPPDPEVDEPKEKIYTRRCKHCDEVYSGTDLDKVKKELTEHTKVCGMNSRAKPYKSKATIPPDPDLDLGVDDPLPEPAEPEKPVKVSVKCDYCKMGATRKDQKTADAWKKKHEASCPKNPANIKPEEPEPEQEPKPEPKPEPDPGPEPSPHEEPSTALSTGQEFPDEREFTTEKVKRHVENRGGFYKNQRGEEVPDSAAMSLYALDTCRISTETILIEKDADQAKAIVRGHKGGVSVDASVILRFDVLRRRELLKMAKKHAKAIMTWTEEMVPILDLNFMLKDKTPVITLGEHMINFAIDQEQFAERTAETLARRRVFDMLSGVDWREGAEVQVEDADAASMGSKKR